MFFRRMFARKDSGNADYDDDDDDNGDVNVDGRAMHGADSNNNNHSNSNNSNNGNSNGASSSDYDTQRRRNEFRKYGPNTAPPTTTAATTTPKHCSSSTTLHRASTSGPAVVQLTPLWEHILRTRTLPDNVCPVKMFAEFLERLRDPEWQVRQHALRVFVDVLVVMGSKADPFMDALVPQLVENLGHPAPTVRKGALDCLRVYLAETAMPETILLQILDIGLNQKITNEPFGGRLTCGVMLSLPALVQSTLHTSKRHFILRSAIEMLVQKMGQVTHQEITLKVLAKIRELIGEPEFVEYMSHGAYREFELLCNVYGVSDAPPHKPTSGAFGKPNGTWRLRSQQSTQSCWRSSDEEQMLEVASQAKVIMETEIKINDDTVTMRILEAKDDDCLDAVPESEDSSPRKSLDTYPNSLEDDVVCGRLPSANSARDAGGVIRLLSDSDPEESSPDRGKDNPQYFTVVTPSTPSRTPKRVTFGGEVVKMRTPDSDATASYNNNSNSDNGDTTNSQVMLATSNKQSAVDAGGGGGVGGGGLGGTGLDGAGLIGGGGSGVTDSTTKPSDSSSGSAETDKIYVAIITTPSTSSTSSPDTESKTTALSLEITNDNTKPLPRPKTASSPKHAPKPNKLLAANSVTQVPSPALTSTNASPLSVQTPLKRRDSTASTSPRSPFKRISISPVDSIISPKTIHKEIEVLHNLQRDPSPIRNKSARRATVHMDSVESVDVPQASGVDQRQQNESAAVARSVTPPPPPAPKSWEDLGIVDYDTLMDLRSGNWRHRLQGIGQLEEALRSAENLARVQPCLDSLLRTLLSSERHAEVAEEKHRLLINLISRLPLDNLEDRAVQIMTGLCRQGGAGANRVCKSLMHRLPAATTVLKLLSQEFLHAKSSRFREHALQMVMFALMTFPSTCFDAATCVTYATCAALNRKRRVRQASLDVLAILGQMTSIRAVLEAVQNVAAPRDEGAALMAAVRARLARKQLPLVTAEGLVQYTLRIPSPHSAADAGAAAGHLGPDIEWIAAGVGSVSPTSLKRRMQRINQSFRCLPPHSLNDDVDAHGGAGSANSGSNHSDDNCTHRHSYCSPPEMYGNAKESTRASQMGMNNDDIQSYGMQQMLGGSMPFPYAHSTKRTNVVDYSNYLGRRMVAKSCSDSSMDGRSSDSTYTSSSGGGAGSSAAGGNSNGAAIPAATGGCGGISGRFTRQTVNSRFPAMDRMDLNATYMRVHKPPTYYPGMGAYAHLQQQQINMSSTYPKINYTLPTHHRRRSQQHQPMHCMNNSNNNSNNNNTNNNINQHAPSRLHQPQANAQENFKRAENLANEPNSTDDNLDGTYTICPGMPNGGNTTTNTINTTTTATTTSTTAKGNQPNSNGRRFVNVEKFIMQSNKSSQTTGTTSTASEQQPIESKQATPVSLKSASYSQKSTASAQSLDSGEDMADRAHHSIPKSRSVSTLHHERIDCSSPTTTIVGLVKKSASDYEVSSGSPAKTAQHSEPLQLEEIVDVALESAMQTLENDNETSLKKNGSLASLQSKTDSIKTQLGDTPPLLSRTQSAKSLLIEEDIEENDSFVLMDELVALKQQQHTTVDSSNATAAHEACTREFSVPPNIGSDEKIGDGFEMVSKPPTTGSRPPLHRRSPTIAELKTLSRRNSMIKSMESLYERPPSKQDSLDNTTTSTDSTSQASSQLNTIIPIKPQHTPLKQKSKTSHFLKSHRRISPVKQSIKMAQAELYPPTLQRFEKPREALLKTFDQLDSGNWEVIIQGLKSMVRLLRYHPEHLENQMHMVCIQLTRSVRNLRSQVARAACQAAAELFTLKSKYLEQECDDLICTLLHRTADTNRFLRGDATRALESMCDNLTPPKVLNILTTKGAQHLNALVRTTSAKLLNRLVERLGSDKVFSMSRDNRDKFFVTGANLLLEGSLETRSYAKSLFRQLSQHHNYQRLLKEVIPQRTYRNVEKTLRSIH